MVTEDFIQVDQLCIHYKVEMSFFDNLNELGLIEFRTVEHTHYLHLDKIGNIEKMIRMHHELDINFEGIDTIFNLLGKIEDLQAELITVKNRLRLYE